MENVSRRASQEHDLCGPTGLYTRKATQAVETAILKFWVLCLKEGPVLHWARMLCHQE